MAGVPLVAPLSNYSAPVHIDVGGTNYTSCLETLTKFPHSKLAKLFNGTLPIAVDPVKQQYFLDRDGKVFRHILNYLRNGELTLPDYFTDTNLLLKEATFFQLEELCNTLTVTASEQQGGTQETDQGDGDSTYEEIETERQRQPGRRSRTWRKKNKQQGAADKSEETQRQSTAAVEDQGGTVLTANPYQEKMECSEVIIVVTYGGGSVRSLSCSDQQFKVELPDTFPGTKIQCLTGKIINSQRYCNYIEASYSSVEYIGFPWLAKYLLQKGYRLISSCERAHYFVK